MMTLRCVLFIHSCENFANSNFIFLPAKYLVQKKMLNNAFTDLLLAITSNFKEVYEHLLLHIIWKIFFPRIHAIFFEYWWHFYSNGWNRTRWSRTNSKSYKIRVLFSRLKTNKTYGQPGILFQHSMPTGCNNQPKLAKKTPANISAIHFRDSDCWCWILYYETKQITLDIKTHI